MLCIGGERLVNWLKEHKCIVFICVVLSSFISLCCWPLQSVLENSAIFCLKRNLDFIGIFIARYPWLTTVAVIVFVVILLIKNFSLCSTSINVLGVKFELKHTETNIKIQIKNYMATKRSIFVLYEEYDNYYDVINSMYNTLTFLRKQIANFDNFSQTNNQCYVNIEGMIKEIGKFLTKYQSDYRRYYESLIKRSKEQFISFRDIQNGYQNVADMTRDLIVLNKEMKKYADFFGINIQKWKDWYL